MWVPDCMSQTGLHGDLGGAHLPANQAWPVEKMWHSWSMDSVNRKYAGAGVGVGLGLCFGAAMGAAMHNIGLGVAFGVGMGVAFSLIFGGAALQREKGKDSD
jgi:hypothetical protein